MTPTSFNAAASALAIALAAAAGARAQQRPGAEDHPPSVRETQQDVSNADQRAFVRQMLMANQAEIRMGQMAVMKTSRPDVRAFGQTIVLDHMRTNQLLLPLADTYGLEVPETLDTQDRTEADQLASLSGDEFDRQFLSVMISAHRRAIREARPFAVAGSTTSAPPAPATSAYASVQQYATATLPVLEEHLQQALQLRQSIEK